MTNGATEAEKRPGHAAPEHQARVCWTCERAADPDATLWALLECLGPAPYALGYEVTVSASETIVRVTEKNFPPVVALRASRWRWPQSKAD